MGLATSNLEKADGSPRTKRTFSLVRELASKPRRESIGGSSCKRIVRKLTLAGMLVKIARRNCAGVRSKEGPSADTKFWKRKKGKATSSIG